MSHIPQVSIGYTGEPYSVWEGTTQKHPYQEVKITGAILEAGFHWAQAFK